MEPTFCPFCGKQSLDDMGGSEEVMQLQCSRVKCGVFFNLEVLVDHIEDDDGEPEEGEIS